MSQKFKVGDHVRVAKDEGLDTPREARDKAGFVTGTIGSAEEGTLEYLVKIKGLPTFNYCHYHLAPVYEVQYIVRSLGQGIPGRHTCTGCERKFVKDEVFEIGSVLLPDDKYVVVNVHANPDCRAQAVIASL